MDTNTIIETVTETATAVAPEVAAEGAGQVITQMTQAFTSLSPVAQVAVGVGASAGLTLGYYAFRRFGLPKLRQLAKIRIRVTFEEEAPVTPAPVPTGFTPVAV